MSRRVLVVVDDFSFGGVPVAVLGMVRGLREQGCEVVLASLRDRVDYPIPEGVPLHRLGINFWSWRRYCWWWPRPSLRAWFEGMERQYGRFDQVLLTWWNAFVLAPDFPTDRTWLWAHLDIGRWMGPVSMGLWRCARKKTPAWLGWLKGGRIVPLRPSVFEGRRMVFVSSGIARQFAADFGPILMEAVVVPNPVDMEAVLEKSKQPPPPGPWIQEPPAVAYLGRLSPEKQVDHLIRAFAASGIPGTLCLIGDGPSRAALVGLAGKLGIGNRLQITGFLSNPFPVLARSRMLALCSRTESFSLAIAEALCLGIPVVSYDTPHGPADLLTGRLREGLVPFQDEEALAEAIVRFHDRSPAVPYDACERLRPGRVGGKLMAIWDAENHVSQNKPPSGGGHE